MSASAVSGTDLTLLKSAGRAPELRSAPGADGPVYLTSNYPWKKAKGGLRMSNINLFNTTAWFGHEWSREASIPFHATRVYMSAGNTELVFQSQLYESQKRLNLYAKRCSCIPFSLSPTLHNA